MRSLNFIQTDDVFTMISRCPCVPYILGLLQPKPQKQRKMANAMDQKHTCLQDMHKDAFQPQCPISNCLVKSLAAGCCTDPCPGVFKTP